MTIRTPYVQTARDRAKAEKVRRYVPALHERHPAGCPDPDWCCGNGVCYWNCKGEDEYP